MAQSDWSLISDAASSSSIERGVVTSAVVPIPAGGGSWVDAMHSLTNATGTVAYYSALANFTPMAKGGVISGGVRKGGAGGSLFSAYLFICLNGQASTNSSYILGLSNSEPAHIILRKGTLAGGCPDVAPGSQGVLRRSTTTFALGEWVHLKLEAILQPNGDVVLNCYQSDLDTSDIDDPTWVAIPGMSSFTDDNLQVNTGSAPLAGGRIGYGSTMAEINRLAAFDQIVTERQTLP